MANVQTLYKALLATRTSEQTYSSAPFNSPTAIPMIQITPLMQIVKTTIRTNFKLFCRENFKSYHIHSQHKRSLIRK